MITINVAAIIAAAGIPSALVGLLVFWFQKKIELRLDNDKAIREKRQKEAEEREDVRIKNELLMIKTLSAVTQLSVATALAIKRGHTNGEMEGALQEANRMMEEQRNFLRRQAVENIYDNGM